MSGSCGWFPMKADEIRAWVEAHQDALPSTLAELSQLPIPFRKVIVAFISPERRVAFWREHMTTFVGPDSKLTAEQQAFVQESSHNLPSLLAAPAPNPVIVAWEARMVGLFSRLEAGPIFGMVGPPEPPEGLPLPADARPAGVV